MLRQAHYAGHAESIKPVANQFRFERWDSADRHYEYWEFGGEPFEEAIDTGAGEGWQKSGGLVSDIPGKAVKRERRRRVSGVAVLDMIFLPGTVIKDGGNARLPTGETARKLIVSPWLAPQTRFFINAETGELRAFSEDDPEDSRKRNNISVIKDYITAPFGHFPKEFDDYVEGELSQKFVFDQIEFDKPAPEKLFNRPENKDRYEIESNLPATVPVSFLSGYLLLEVTLNESTKTWFLLDTGAGPTCLTKELAAKLGLRLGEKYTSESGIGNFPTRASRLPSIAVGGALMREMPVDVIMDNALDVTSVATGRKVEGILGNSFLNAFLPTVDYGKMRLLLRRPDSPTPPGIAVPLVMLDETPAAEVRIAGGKPIDLTFDTGAPSSWLPPTYSSILPGSMVKSARGRAMVGIPRIAVGDAVLTNVTADTAPLPLGRKPTGDILLDEETGLYGSDLLRYYRFSIDYRRQKLILDPLTKPAVGVEDYVGFGLWLKKLASKARVQHVQPFSSAYRAGIAEGDEVVRIAENPVAKLTEAKLTEKLWIGREGEPVRLTVRSRGRIRVVTLRRERLSP